MGARVEIIVRQPLVVTAPRAKYDAHVSVKAAERQVSRAIRHGIARALLEVDADTAPL